MNPEERRKYIMTLATRDGSVSIPDTARQLGVSIETIRRDINRLCAENKLSKVYGGAVPVKRALRRDIDYYSRVERNRQAKTMIGAAAAHLVKNGDVVMLDCGIVQSCLGFTNLRCHVSLPIPYPRIIRLKKLDGDIDDDNSDRRRNNCRTVLPQGRLRLRHSTDTIPNCVFRVLRFSRRVSSYDIDESLIRCLIAVRRLCAYRESENSARFFCRFAVSLTSQDNRIGKPGSRRFSRVTGELIIAGDAYHT